MNYQKSSVAEYASLLQKYLEIVPYLVPRQVQFHRPILRHSDLRPNNIFCSEDLSIVGIIDWQHCSVLPSFLAAGIPRYVQNYHDEESLRNIPPRLLQDFGELDEDDQAKSLEQFRRRHLHFFYWRFTKQFNASHFEALNRRTDLLTRKAFSHAGEPWEGNNIPLKADLVFTAQAWAVFMEENQPGQDYRPPSPLPLPEPDVQDTLHVLSQQEEMDDQLKNLRDIIGVTAEGWTSNEEYLGALERARMIKIQGIESLDTQEEKDLTMKHWPFDDFDEEC